MAAIVASVRRRSLPPSFPLLRLQFFSRNPSFLCTASANRAASPDPHSMVEYLMKSCGFSASEAAKATAKPFARLQSIEKAHAVLSFMRSQGFSAGHLRKLILDVPRCLRFDVETTLAPKLQSLRSIGFSDSDLVDIIVAQPGIFSHNFSRSVIPKLKMWESIFGSRELLIKHAKRKSRFLTCSEEKVASNMKFFTDEYGIPKERVYLALRTNPNFIVQKTDSLRALAVRAEELGVPRKSRMFIWTLHILTTVSKERYQAKLKLMRSIGWSDSEFISAFIKAPCFLGISQEALRRKAYFLLKKVGCSPSYIAERPKLLMHSLEKRIIPRFRVMELLKSEGLWKHQPFSFFTVPDAKFRVMYVHCHKDKVPKLRPFCKLQLDENGDDSSYFDVENMKVGSQS